MLLNFLSTEHPKTEEPEIENVSETFKMFFLLFENQKSEQRPDYHNFRQLMWKTMSHIPRVVEKRSRFVMPLFFQFIEYDFECLFFLVTCLNEYITSILNNKCPTQPTN